MNRSFLKYITKIGLLLIVLTTNGVSDLWAAEVYRYLSDWQYIELVESDLQELSILQTEEVADTGYDVDKEAKMNSAITLSFEKTLQSHFIIFPFENGQLSYDLSHLFLPIIFSRIG